MTFPMPHWPADLQPCIVGIGETGYARRGGIPDKTELSLCLEAIRTAAADAGIDAKEIDG